MFCPKCGNEVQDGSAFCGKCGAKVEGMDVESTPASTTAQVSAAVAKKKKVPLIAGAVIAAVVVVAVALICLNVFGGVAVKNSTEEYSWNELSKISAEIAGAADATAAVEVAKKYNLTTADGKLDGTQTKSVALSNGIQTAVQIAGFAHDDKSDGSGKAGITFIFKDCIAEHDMNSTETNAGGWEGSDMRKYLSSEGISFLPSDLRNKVVAVNKLTNNTGETDTVLSVTATSDKIWLFSFVELAGFVGEDDASFADIRNAEGMQYKLFKDQGVNPFYENENLVRYLTKEPDVLYGRWWERSPVPGSSSDYYRVGNYDDGVPNYVCSADYSEGVCPGFCI